VDGTHEIANAALRGDVIHLPFPLESSWALPLGHLTHALAKIIGKKEIVLQQQHVRFDVEKTKRYRSVTDGFKSKRHHASDRGAE
jgi:hypothetical protein